MGCVPEPSVGYPKILTMPFGKLISRVLVLGICECLFWGHEVGSSLWGCLGARGRIYLVVSGLELGSVPGPVA